MVQATPAVVDAARILKFLSRYQTARATLSQIAAKLSIPKSTCSRILKALADEGLLAYNAETKLYSLGTYAIVIGSRASETVDYFVPIRSALDELVERTTLTAAWVQITEPDRMMYIAKQEGTSHPHVSVSVGNRFPMLEVSYGQWVVAYAEPEEQRRLLENGLPVVTETNITDPDAYLTHAVEGRKRGVLTSSGDYVRGVWTASAPVLTHEDRLIGVLVILGIAQTLDRAKQQQYAQDVASVAQNIHI
jgi:IclR family KDG regulon transcriptional repressor